MIHLLKADKVWKFKKFRNVCHEHNLEPELICVRVYINCSRKSYREIQDFWTICSFGSGIMQPTQPGSFHCIVHKYNLTTTK